MQKCCQSQCVDTKENDRELLGRMQVSLAAVSGIVFFERASDMVTNKSTVFLIFLTCVIGAWLFYLKYSVISIGDRICEAKLEIIEEKKNHHILRAEWRSLTSPDRIQRLAVQYLKMRQLEPKQLREFDISIFHSDTTKREKTKKLSRLVDEILSQDSNKNGMQ
jgi:cell division protein FtsL